MIFPRYLRTGDKVGVVATAKKVHKDNTLKGIDILKSWGLDVHIGEHTFSAHHQFAGTDHQRAGDLQKFIDDPDVKAIFMVRGGYGSTRIIDRINFEPLIRYPKWLCGFSDITSFHLHLFKLGIASIHSPMPSFFYALDKPALNWLEQHVFGNSGQINANAHLLNRLGHNLGKLVGGNLSLICHTIGTASQIEADGNILFIEDVDEQLYNLDRMMVQLKRAGVLNKLKGLIVGQFTDMKDNEDSFGMDAYEIIHSHVSDFDYPLAFNFPIGHSSNNWAVPVGVDLELNIDEAGSILKIGNQETTQ